MKDNKPFPIDIKKELIFFLKSVIHIPYCLVIAKNSNEKIAQHDRGAGSDIGQADLHALQRLADLETVGAPRGEAELDAMDFLKMCREKMELVEMPKDLMNRSINEGFSGGERKRNEVLQMAVLEPELAREVRGDVEVAIEVEVDDNPLDAASDLEPLLQQSAAYLDGEDLPAAQAVSTLMPSHSGTTSQALRPAFSISPPTMK